MQTKHDLYWHTHTHGNIIPVIDLYHYIKTFLKLQDAQKGICVGEYSESMSDTRIDNHTKGIQKEKVAL